MVLSLFHAYSRPFQAIFKPFVIESRDGCMHDSKVLPLPVCMVGTGFHKLHQLIWSHDYIQRTSDIKFAQELVLWPIFTILHAIL